MPPELARYTVMPHARGSERIIAECVRGDWGSPEWRDYEGQLFVAPAAAGSIAQVRFRHLELNGFRAYREKQDFELDADIIVLFGPNGFGKTSFFDAIDFACTGSVARFDERFGRDVERLAKSLVNLDSSPEDCYVVAVLSVDGKDVSIRRCLSDHTKATVDGATKSRKQTLLAMAGLSQESADIRVENLVRLFRATHLFGQEYQSLTCDFRKESTLNEDIVSRMLALQDYVQAIEKTSQVTGDLQRQIREKNDRIANMDKDLLSKQVQMDELQKLSKSVEQPEVVARIAKEIAVRVAKAGIKVEDSAFNGNTTRGWRSLISAKITSLERRVSIVNQVETKYPEYEACKKRLAETLVQLSQGTTSLDDVNGKIKEVQAKLVSASALVERILIEEKPILDERDNLNWLLAVGPKYVTLAEEVKKESLAYNDFADKVTTVTSRVALLASQRESLLSTIQDKRTQSDDLQRKVADLNQLQGEIGQWQSCVEQQKRTAGDLQTSAVELADLEHDLNLKQEECLTAERYYTELGLRLTAMQGFHSELQQLLYKLEEHIVSNICPSCGARYDSKDELIERLRKSRGSESGELHRLIQAHSDAKSKYEQLEGSVSDLQNRVRGARQKRDKAVETLLDLRDRISQYQQRLSAFDIQATAERAEEGVDAQKRSNLETLRMRQRELDDLLSQVGCLDNELLRVRSEQVSLLATMQEIVARQEALKTQVATISQQALDRRVSISATQEAVRNKLGELENLSQDKRKDLELAKATVVRVQDEASQLEMQRHSLQSQVDQLSILRDSQTTCIDDLRKLVTEIGLIGDVDADKIQEVCSQFSQELGKLNELHNDLSNLETVLNDAEMSVSTARISRERGDLGQAIQTEKQVLGKLDHWCVYFQTVRGHLEELRSRALQDYTKSYGPLSSVIQRRLRSVYGFGDVELRVHKGTIIVEVERQGHKGLSPSDYFSESQIQIAMLSLFLSANLTQNWSRFCPVLLDDPVEHFDDLNSYALLGLIKRLALRERYGRQFIISTCDERLYKLMRQQFSAIDGKVAYYRFSAIGERGPVVEQD